MSDGSENAIHLNGDEALTRVRELLHSFRSAMFLTVLGGEAHARPMGLLGDPDRFEGSLWFFADDRSRKVREVRVGAKTMLICQSDNKNAYLQLNGTAVIDNNSARKVELFTPLVKTWFPEGLEDPRLTLIRFDAESGEFWDSPGGMLQVLAAFTKSVVTGKPGAGGRTGELEL